MAAKLRQEINILDHSLTVLTSNERVQLDTTQYNGTVTYYFEIVASASSGSPNVTLRDISDNSDDATVTITGSTYTLYRSSSFTPPAGQTTYKVVPGANATVKSARIVIIQEADTLTNTETQIEIGNYNLARTTETEQPLTNPKYWKYDASKWDGTKTFYAEAVYDSGDMDTITVNLQTTTDILAPSWSDDVQIVGNATTTVPTRTRVAFTPVDGSWYRITSLNGSMDNHDIYRAGIVVDQADASQLGATAGGASLENNATLAGYAQAFSINATSTITAVTITFGKSNSPSDNLDLNITSSLGGSSLAHASIAGSDISTIQAYLLTLDSSVVLTGGTTYYLELTRSGATDTTNDYSIRWKTNTTYGTFGVATKSAGSWEAVNTSLQMQFYLTGNAGFTKLEPQYLLANTLFAAGTGLQTFLTKWDSTEWDDGAGSINYYFQAEAANGSTSDVTLNQADGGGAVTNSTLTNIDNAQISAAMTMPGDENLDVTATTNAGDVAAARILVAYVFSAAAPEPTPPYPRTRRGMPGTGILRSILLFLISSVLK